MAKTTYDWEGITPLAYELLPRYLAANKIYDQNDALGVYDALGNLINGLNSNNYNMELSGAITGAPNSTEYRHAATILNAVRDSVAKKAVPEPEKKKWDDKILLEALLTTAFGNSWTRGEKFGLPMATSSMWQLWRDKDAVGSDGKRGKENRKKALNAAIKGVIQKIDSEYGEDEEAQKIKNILATAVLTNTPQYAHTIADWLLSDELPAKKESEGNGSAGQNPTQTNPTSGNNPVNPANPTGTPTPEDSDWLAFLDTTPDFESESFNMGRPDEKVVETLLMDDDLKHRRLVSDYFSDVPVIEAERLKYYTDPYVFDKTTNLLTPSLEDYQWMRAKDKPHEFWDQIVFGPIFDSGGWNAYDPKVTRAWTDPVTVDPEYGDVYGDNTRPGDVYGIGDDSFGMSARAWRLRNLTNMLLARHLLNSEDDSWRRLNSTQEISEIDLKNNGVWVVDFGSMLSGGNITRKFIGFKKFFSDENIPDDKKLLIKDTILLARATKAKRHGGVIKALSGVKIKKPKPQPTEEEMLLNEPKDGTARTIDQLEYQNQKARDSRKEFTGVDKARVATVALDTIGLISSLIPSAPGLAISGATGLASTGLTLGLDIADPTVTKGLVLTNLGMNAALTIGGLVPGIGKVAQAKKIATGLSWLVKAVGGAAAAITAWNCGPEATSAIKKVLDGRISAVTVGEMKSLAYTLGAAAGLFRTGRNSIQRRRYDSQLSENPSSYTLKDVSATKTVKTAEGGAGETKTDIKASITLTPEELAKIDAAGKQGGNGKALSELNAIAKSRPELKDIEFTSLPEGTTYVPPVLRRMGAGLFNRSIQNSAEITEKTSLANRIADLDRQKANKAGRSLFKTDYEILRYGNESGWSPFAGRKMRELRRQARGINQPGQTAPAVTAPAVTPAEEAVREAVENKVEEAAAEAKAPEAATTETKAAAETKVTEESVKEAATSEAVEKVAEETRTTPAAIEEAAGGSAVTEAIAEKAAKTASTPPSPVKPNRVTAEAYNKLVEKISNEIKKKIKQGKKKGVDLSIRGSKNWRDKHSLFTLDQMDKAGNFAMFSERPIMGGTSMKASNKKLFWKLLRNEKDVPFASARPLTYDSKTNTWIDAKRHISYGESPFNRGDIRGMKIIGNNVYAYDQGGQIRYFLPGGQVDKYGKFGRGLYGDLLYSPQITPRTTNTTPITTSASAGVSNNPTSTGTTTNTTSTGTTLPGITSVNGYAPKAATDPLESWHSPYPDLDYSDLKYNLSTIGTMAGAGLTLWAMTNRDLAEKAKIGAKRSSFVPSMPEKVYRRNIKQDALANLYASKLDSSYARALGLGSDVLTSTTAFNAQRANLLQNLQENELNELTRMNSISEANQAQRYTEAKARLTTMDANREAARLLKNSILDERMKNNSKFLAYGTNLATNVFSSLKNERNYQNKKALSDWTTKFNLSAINHLSPNTLNVYTDNPTYRDLLMLIYGMQGAEAADNMASYLQNALATTPAPVVTPATTNK